MGDQSDEGDASLRGFRTAVHLAVLFRTRGRWRPIAPFGLRAGGAASGSGRFFCAGLVLPRLRGAV